MTKILFISTHTKKKKKKRINVFYLSNQGVLSGRSMVQKG